MFKKMLSKVQNYHDRINRMSGKKKIVCLIGLCVIFPEEMIIILISYKIFKSYKTYNQLKQEIALLKITNSYLQEENNELKKGLGYEVSLD